MCGSGCCDLDPGSPSQPAETGSTTAAATASSTAAAAAAVASGTRVSFQDDRDARGGGAIGAASAGSEARCEDERPLPHRESSGYYLLQQSVQALPGRRRLGAQALWVPKGPSQRALVSAASRAKQT